MVIQWIIFGLVILIMCSFPILFNFFGKEDGCGRSKYDIWKSKKNKY